MKTPLSGIFIEETTSRNSLNILARTFFFFFLFTLYCLVSEWTYCLPVRFGCMLKSVSCFSLYLICIVFFSVFKRDSSPFVLVFYKHMWGLSPQALHQPLFVFFFWIIWVYRPAYMHSINSTDPKINNHINLVLV